MTVLRSTQEVLLALVTNSSYLRSTQQVILVAADDDPVKVQLNTQYVEVLYTAPSGVPLDAAISASALLSADLSRKQVLAASLSGSGTFSR